MKINRKRIIHPQHYLYALHPGEQFYIAAPLDAKDQSRLALYGLHPNAPAQIPKPVHAATYTNANGYWRILKHLPKELRSYEQAYHVVDWNGYHHDGICWHHRMCYQRELIPPTELAFSVKDDVLYSPLLVNDESELQNIKAAMNVVLEMVGHCEVWTAECAPAIPPVKQIQVPWEILRSGTTSQNEWQQYIDRVVERKPHGQQTVIRHRHEHLWHMSPDFCVLGSQNFWGYVIYGFTSLNLFIFECNEVNNATYVFRGDWETASQLTKTQVLTGHMQEARIYHTEKWYEYTRKLVDAFGKEVA